MPHSIPELNGTHLVRRRLIMRLEYRILESDGESVYWVAKSETR